MINIDLLIQKIEMDCPLCDQRHQVSERKRLTKVIVKGDPIEYEESYYSCENCPADENEFMPAKILDANLMRARNAYRKKMGLLTVGEIVAIREKYGLSQIEMSNLLGWGEATISRYESKAIQDETYDSILRLVDNNPMETLGFLQRNRSKFSVAKYLSIKEKIIENLDEYGKEYLKRQELESEYVRYQEPSDLNGYQILDIDKIESVVTFFAISLPSLYKVKLMKMLWYADALCFKRHNKAITGLVYKHMPLGALPVGHYRLLDLERINFQEEYDSNQNSMYHIMPYHNIDLSILSQNELTVLTDVIAKFRLMNGQSLINYMHDEIAYQQTNDKQEIPFSLAKQLRDF